MAFKQHLENLKCKSPYFNDSKFSLCFKNQSIFLENLRLLIYGSTFFNTIYFIKLSIFSFIFLKIEKNLKLIN